jgi:GNAT superfamily N-acetyltransferase
LRWEHERAVAALLARAFVDDPLVIAICEAPPPERLERMRWGFRVAVRGHCLAGQPGWTATDAGACLGGVVLASRPQRGPTDGGPVSPDWLFALRGLWHLGLRAGRRGLIAARVIAAHAPAQPFTYLRTLGVEPALQRRGLGSRLVAQVVGAAPSTLPVYLETAKEQNLAFYGRHGFGCTGEFQCLGVRVWSLLRAPRGNLAGGMGFG